MNRFVKGREGEEMACRFLEGKGYGIVARNFRGGGGEIDIIAKTGTGLVFVEVKSWKTVPFCEAGYSIGRRKKARMAGAARQFIFENPGSFHGFDIRFDLVFIDITGGTLSHIENVLSENGRTRW